MPISRLLSSASSGACQLHRCKSGEDYFKILFSFSEICLFSPWILYFKIYFTSKQCFSNKNVLFLQWCWCCFASCFDDCCWAFQIFPFVNQQFVGREGKFYFNTYNDSYVLVELIFWLFAFIPKGYQVPVLRQPAIPSLLGPQGQSIPTTGKKLKL